MSTNTQSNIFAFFLYAISCIVFYFYPTYVFLIVNISFFILVCGVVSKIAKENKNKNRNKKECNNDAYYWYEKLAK